MSSNVLFNKLNKSHMKNMNRSLLEIPEENKEKIELSCACINLMKSYSHPDKKLKNLINEKNINKKIL